MRKLRLFTLLIALFSLIGFSQVVKATPETTNVTIKYYLDGEEQTSQAASHPDQAVGSLLKLQDIALGNHSFLFWTVNGAVIRELPQNPSIRVKSTLELGVYFMTDGKKAGIFLDSNLKLLSASYVDGTSAATTPTNPVKPLSNFDGWALIDAYDGDVIEDFTLTEPLTFFVAKYSVNAGNVTVIFNGTTNDYPVNSVVELTSDVSNPVWKDSAGNILGHGSPFNFTVIEDIEVSVEAGDEISDYVAVRGPFTLRDNYHSYIGRFDVGEKVVVEFGFILSDDSKAPAKSLNEATNEYIVSFKASDYTVKAAYVTYLEGDVATTIEVQANLPIPVTHTVTVNGEVDTFDMDPAVGPYSVGTEITFLFDKVGYVLDTLTVDGVDVLSQVEAGFFTLTVAQDHLVDFTWRPTILTVRGKTIGENVEFEGIITTIDGDNITIQDDTAAISLYKAIKPNTLAVGDKARVTGSLAEYKGLIQIGEGGSIEVISSGHPVFEPTVLTSLDNFTDYMSQYVTIENLEYVRAEQNGRNIVVKLGDQELTLRGPASGDVFEKLQLINYKVTITNALATYFDGNQINVLNVDQITIIEMSDEDKIIEIMLTLDEYDQSTYDMGTDVPFITTHPIYGGTITWAYNPAEAVVDGKFVALNEEDTLVIATATITVGEATDTNEVMFTIRYIVPGSIIEYVLTSDRTGLTNTVYRAIDVEEDHGRWSGSANNTDDKIGTNASNSVIFTANEGYYIAAVQIIVNSGSGTARNVKVGNITIASGVVATNSPHDSGIIDLPGDLTTITLSASGALNYTSIKVYVKAFTPNLAREDLDAITFEEEYIDLSTLTLITTGTVHGSEITWVSSHPENVGTDVKVLPENTEEITLTATATVGSDTYTRAFTFIVVGVRNRLQAQLELLPMLPGNVEEDLELQQVTEDGTTITWQSSHPDIITNEGAVTRPTEANVEVTMTASLTEAGYTEVREYIVTVIKEGAAAPTGSLMIYEVYGGGGNSGATYTTDYIILYNGTDEAIDLEGYSIQYAAQTGSFTNRARLTGTIASKGYFVITGASGANGDALPVQADVTTKLNLAAANGKVALAKTESIVKSPTDTHVVDFVGFGTANAYEGSAGAAPAGANAKSIKRISFDDTNDNKNDFAAGTPDLSYLIP